MSCVSNDNLYILHLVMAYLYLVVYNIYRPGVLMQNIAFELGLQHENVYKSCYGDAFLPSKSMPSPFSASNVERLKYGFEDYILKRCNNLDNNHGLSLNAM